MHRLSSRSHPLALRRPACWAFGLLLTTSLAFATADLYIKDTPADTGIEPNPDAGPMWISQDIWVRNTPDPGYQPYPFPEGSPPWAALAHQNPEYRDPKYSVPSYVYVRVRNRGTTASSGTERLRVYWAKASTGLAWPAQWVDHMASHCGPTKLYGIEITKPRKNAATATVGERNAYRDAIVAIGTMAAYQFADGVSYWHKQNAIHATPPPMAHGSPGFTPWHREYLNRYEILLQQHNPLVRLMYWDWTTDPENSSGVNLFTTAFMGISGRGSGGATVGAPFNVLAPPTLTRNLSPSTTPPAQPDATVLAPASYPTFRTTLESAPNHNSAHGYIGGGGNISFISSAAQDPFFFMLHGNVDRLWAQWQRNPGDVSRLDAATTYGTQSGHAHINVNMSPWDGSAGLAPWTVAGGYIVNKTSKHRSVVYPPVYDTAPLVIPVLQPGQAVVIEIPWHPPNPADFACFGDAGHFCLLARIETATAPPFGMTIPELTNVSVNTRNNNNIAWRNITVVDNFPGAQALSLVIIRNVFPVLVRTSLRLTPPQGGFDPNFLEFGNAQLVVSPRIYDAWRQGGGRSEGVEDMGNGRFQIFSPQVALHEIPLEPGVAESVGLEYELNRQYPSPHGQQILWDLTQLGSPENPQEVIGGVRFAADFNRLRPVKSGSEWRYRDGGKDPGRDWQDPGYDDGDWAQGTADLGYGGNPRTVIDGGAEGQRHISAQFRKQFVVDDPAVYRSLWLELRCDDGAVVYLNGEEIHRFNLPAGVPITPETRALRAVEGIEETVPRPTPLPNALHLLRAGTNVIAASVHQVAPESPDLVFDLELFANPSQTRFPPVVGLLSPPDGALLQAGQNAVISAEALDFDGQVVGVDIYGDGQLLGRLTMPPYLLTWTNPPTGNREVRAVAVDDHGQTGVAFATFGVVTNLPPVVTILSPPEMAMYDPGQPIPLEALASDPAGAVRTVEFHLVEGHDFDAPTRMVLEVASPPYLGSLEGVPPGAYRIFARAWDFGGLWTDSDQRHIHVMAPPASLKIEWMGMMLMLTWDDPLAKLETAPRVTGPWSEVVGAQSPYHVMPTDPERYFRLNTMPGHARPRPPTPVR